jgi:hypothetical protein
MRSKRISNEETSSILQHLLSLLAFTQTCTYIRIEIAHKIRLKMVLNSSKCRAGTSRIKWYSSRAKTHHHHYHYHYNHHHYHYYYYYYYHYYYYYYYYYYTTTTATSTTDRLLVLPLFMPYFYLDNTDDNNSQ